MSAKATKKTAKKKVVKKKVAKKKAAKKKAGPKAAPRTTASAKKPAKKPPLTAAMKKERAAARAIERRFIRESEERLQQRRAALIAAYHAAKGNTKASNTGGTEDYIDYAVSSYARDFSLSLTELERHQLLLVEDALRRIGRNEYGVCLNCGISIPQRRLAVEAWARYCIPCAELDDRGMLEDPGFDGDADAESGDDRKPDIDDADEDDYGD